MTVATSTSKSGPYAGAGTTGPFTVDFRFLENSHLQVIKTSAAGQETTLVLDSAYTVAGAGDESGTVTLTSALPAGERLTIIRDVPATQEADYVQNDSFPAESHERALDKLTMLVQQNTETIGRSLKLPVSAPDGVSSDLPQPQGNKILAWNQDGTAIQNLDAAGLSTVVAFGTANADVFTGDGVTTTYSLTANPGAQANLDVAIGGATQIPGIDYLWAGGTSVTFTTAPPNGVSVLLRYFQGLPQGVTDSAASTYQQAGAGAVLGNVRDALRRTPDAADFGAAPGIAIDNSPKINAALLAHNHVRIMEPGFYRCDSMIELNTGKTLELGGGVFLKRYSANSASTEPVIWIKGSNAALIGAGHGSSSIFSQNRAPAGVVSLGHRDMTQSHGNVLYSTIRGVLIGGGVDYGQTSGAPDIALFLCSPQIGGLASYFHNVSDICVQDVNIGVALYGEANANTIRGVQGVRIGNVTHPTPLRNAMFVNAGATDNSISETFFHQSPNTTCLIVDNYDNSATPGGSNHIQQANTWHGITCEQGGGSAIGLRALVGTGACHYDIMSNCAGGDVLAAGFYDNNWRVGYGVSKNSFLAEAGTQKIRYGVNTADLAVMQEKYLRLSALTENTTYKAVTMTMPSNSNSVLVSIQFATGAGAGLDFQGAGEVTYEVRRSSAGVVAATAIRSRYTGLCRPCIPEISGTDAILKFAVFNNGTASSVTSLFAKVTVIGTVVPTYHETPTVGTAGTVLPSTTAVKGTTAQRPALVASDAGQTYLDTTLAAAGKPITWTGTQWVDGLGAVV